MKSRFVHYLRVCEKKTGILRAMILQTEKKGKRGRGGGGSFWLTKAAHLGHKRAHGGARDHRSTSYRSGQIPERTIPVRKGRNQSRPEGWGKKGHTDA